MHCTNILLTPFLLLTILLSLPLHVHLPLASAVALPAIGYIHPPTSRSPSPFTLIKRASSGDIRGPEDIPSTCKSACPDSFFKTGDSCSQEPAGEMEACLCGKGQDFLDQWSSCDACLEKLFDDHKSRKPDCTKISSESE